MGHQDVVSASKYMASLFLKLTRATTRVISCAISGNLGVLQMNRSQYKTVASKREGFRM